jgi:hypothetical protein
MKHDVKKAAKQEVEKAIKDHETKMHAKGGMVCRGMGAAKKGGKFVKNG